MLYYVNAAASRDGNGSKEMPFKWINDAAKLAKPGDEIIVAPGIYREKVTPKYAGEKDRRITYRAEVPGQSVITGSEKFSDWEPYEGNTYVARIDNGVFAGWNPYKERVCGDWYFSQDIRHTGFVVLNDRMMYEASTLEECLAGEPTLSSWTPEESIYKYYTEQDGDTTVIYANFQGIDPREADVEIAVRRNCFMPDENWISYITVSGFVIKNAATTWAPPAAYQDGAIGPHWSKGWIIEDCEVYNSRCCGISLGKYRDPENDMYFYTKHVKSPTQMERDAVCRGQYHGWLKERVGSHIVRRCEIHHCEQTGIVGRMGGVFSTIEDCHIHHVCNSSQLGGAETAGIKLHAAIDVTVKRCHIHNCIMGVWFDWQSQGARITQNLMHDNMPPEGTAPARGSMYSCDIFIEVGHGPTLIDNNLLLSKGAVSIPTEGVACVHNLMLGAFLTVNSGVDSVVNGQREPRYTPYHIRHRTEVAGFMTILHGDDRVYNNIMVQYYPVTDPERPFTSTVYEVAGTAQFDIFPSYEEWIAQFDFTKEPHMGELAKAHFGHLPVWIDGNAYFGGAKVSKHDKNALVNDTDEVKVELSCEDGKCVLKTNVFELVKGFERGIITSDILGQAFEPEQRYENPDGTEIIFNRDYFGDHRGTKAIPGPFAEVKSEYTVL